MSEKLPHGAVTVEITDPHHLVRVGQMYGQAELIEALNAVPNASRLPGFGLALAVAEKVFAEKRADTVAANIRLIAKAGHDVATNRSLTLQGTSLILEPADLVDMAEGPA